jgi:hypothetical protein
MEKCVVGGGDIYPSNVGLLLRPCGCVGGILPFCRISTRLLLGRVPGLSAVSRLLRRSAGRRLGQLLGLVAGFLAVLPFLRVLPG